MIEVIDRIVPEVDLGLRRLGGEREKAARGRLRRSRPKSLTAHAKAEFIALQRFQSYDANAQSFVTQSRLFAEAVVAQGTIRKLRWVLAASGSSYGTWAASTDVLQTSVAFQLQDLMLGRPAGGSYSPTRAIRFVLKVLGLDAAGREVAGSNIMELAQDEMDCLRQEYLDLGTASAPSRGQLRFSLGSPWNTGNYNYQLDEALQARFSAVRSAMSGVDVVGPDLQPITVNGRRVRMVSPVLQLESGYRCPRRNVAVGSSYPTGSYHVWGRALDVIPGMSRGRTEDGRDVALELHRHMYPTCLAAARSTGVSAICEAGAVPVPPGNPSENHVHVQW